MSRPGIKPCQGCSVGYAIPPLSHRFEFWGSCYQRQMVEDDPFSETADCEIRLSKMWRVLDAFPEALSY
jgi:hypothetical protein